MLRSRIWLGGRGALRAGLVIGLAWTLLSIRDFAHPVQSGATTAPDQDSSSGKQAEGQVTEGKNQKESKTPPGDPGAALDFLGSYSASQAVLATETGHTSARPPAASTDRRLTELAADLGKVPAEPSELRHWLLGMLATPEHSPEDWFRMGTAALEAARVDSRRLTEVAPSSAWNQRLEAEALANRYPALARSIWNDKQPAPASAALSTPSGAGSTSTLANAHGDLDRLNRAPESPENLYTRARLLLGVSQEAFVRAAASPQLDARLYALQGLAAEDENDEGGALSEYQKGLAKYPESALLNAGLGHLYRERNDLEASRSELEKAWRLDSTDALVGFELGDVELRMGRAADAIAMLDRALDLDPDLLVARWARGRAYISAGGEGADQRALEDLQAAETCDRSGMLELQLAEVYTKLGRTADAQEARRKSEEQRRALAETKRPATPQP